MPIEIDTPAETVMKDRMGMIALVRRVLNMSSAESMPAFTKYTNSQLAQIIEAKRDDVFDFSVVVKAALTAPRDVEGKPNWASPVDVMAMLTAVLDGQAPSEAAVAALGVDVKHYKKLLPKTKTPVAEVQEVEAPAPEPDVVAPVEEAPEPEAEIPVEEPEPVAAASEPEPEVEIPVEDNEEVSVAPSAAAATFDAAPLEASVKDLQDQVALLQETLASNNAATAETMTGLVAAVDSLATASKFLAQHAAQLDHKLDVLLEQQALLRDLTLGIVPEDWPEPASVEQNLLNVDTIQVTVPYSQQVAELPEEIEATLPEPAAAEPTDRNDWPEVIKNAPGPEDLRAELASWGLVELKELAETVGVPRAAGIAHRAHAVLAIVGEAFPN